VNRRGFLKLALTLSAGGVLVPGEIFRGRSQVAIVDCGFTLRENIEEAMRMMSTGGTPKILIAGEYLWSAKEKWAVHTKDKKGYNVYGIKVIR